jgi:hypothetical protein
MSRNKDLNSLRLLGAVLFLTAGHALKELDRLRKSDQVEITGAVLADTMGAKRISDIPIPFDLMNARLFYIDDEGDGLDFGVVCAGGPLCPSAREKWRRRPNGTELGSPAHG